MGPAFLERVHFASHPFAEHPKNHGYSPGVKALGKHPEIGRPVEQMPPEFRERVIELGQGAYVALYRCDGKEAAILTVRHGREAGH